ncbi:hypothetical protein F4778DRAFT_801000 [Xylariomycetidae sp. FL2044]|nr:hypothetical protein F4778DRAFT_801000 [Xylariomycetidae sp. FL2044]
MSSCASLFMMHQAFHIITLLVSIAQVTGYSSSLPASTAQSENLRNGLAATTTAPIALTTTAKSSIQPLSFIDNSACNISTKGLPSNQGYTCPYGLSCAYDPTLSILGCFGVRSSTGLLAITRSMYTGCEPYTPQAIQYLSVTEERAVSCAGGQPSVDAEASMTQTGYDYCATKVLVVRSLTLSQYYCASEQQLSYTSTLNLPPTATIPLAKVDVLDPLSGFNTPSSDADTQVKQSSSLWIGLICGTALLLVLLILVVIRLYSARNSTTHSSVLATESGSAVADDDYDADVPILTLSYRDKLGWLGMVSLLLPVPVISACIGILSAFWKTPTHPGTEKLEDWVLDNKLPTVIAVLSLCLRFSLASHTALGISMLASIALESFAVGIVDIPRLLIQRSSNAASFDLSLLFLRKVLRKKEAAQSMLMFIPSFLITALSVALQFTSTFLLMDLGAAQMRGHSSMKPFPMGYDDVWLSRKGGAGSSINYAAAPPVAYPPFAEYARESQVRDDFDYTSDCTRAFLPDISQSFSQSVRNYSGYATAIDASTICVRPPFVDLAIEEASDPLYLAINSTIDPSILDGRGLSKDKSFFKKAYSTDSPNGQFSHDEGALVSDAFHCLITKDPLTTNPPSLEDVKYMCSLGGVRAFAFVDMVDVNLNTGADTSHDTFERGSNLTWSATSLSDFIISQGQSWTTLSYKDKPYAWQISLCSTLLKPQCRIINAWSDTPLSEPTLAIDNTTRDLNTENVLRWLGASKESASLSERGVLAMRLLENNDPWLSPRDAQPRIGDVLMSAPLSGNPLGQYHRDGNMTYRICNDCPQDFVENLGYFHPVYSKILEDTLASTGQPAIALQAFWTLVYQSYYYDNLRFFNVFGNSTYEPWTAVVVPVSKRGFIAVCSMIAAHLVLMCAILYVFLRHTKFSKIHDPWLAYTQVHHGELDTALDELSAPESLDPEPVLRQQEGFGEAVGLDLDVLGRIVGVRRRNKKFADLDASDDSD